MDKEILTRFIAKYNVSGIDGVSWEVDSQNNLTTKFASDDHCLFGTIRTENVSLEEGTYGIIGTRTLNSLLGVLGSDITVKIKKNARKSPVALIFKDDANSCTFMLADLQVIPPAFKGTTIPAMNATFILDNNFITTFVKAKNALSDAETFTVFYDNDGARVIIGYHPTQNSHQVSIPIENPTGTLSRGLIFNADRMKEILVANKDSKNVELRFSEEGLLYIVFEVEGFEVEYYIVEMQQ